MRKDLKIPHPNDQISEVQGWLDTKPGLSRRCSATGQLAGSLKMNIDYFLCMESFSGSTLPLGIQSPSLLWPALSCSSCISSFSFHLCCTGRPFPSWNSACCLLPQGLCSCCVCHLELSSNLIIWQLSICPSVLISNILDPQDPGSHCIASVHLPCFLTNVCHSCYQMVIYVTSHSL